MAAEGATYAAAGLRKAFTVSEFAYTRRALDAELASKAAMELGVSVASIVVRDILPATDFGTTYYSYDIWRKDMSAGTVNSWNQVAKTDLDGDKLIGIFGVAKGIDGDDIVSAVRFKRGDTEIIDIWQIDDLEPGEAAITDTPIIYSSKDTVNIYHYLKNTGVDAVILIGRVAETAGREITAGKKVF